MYLCTALREKHFLKKKFWRGGRVVDCGGLENRCAARHPGFESLSLRWKELQNKENPCKLMLYMGFLFLVHSKNKHIKAFWTFAYSIRMQFSLFFSSLYDAPSLFLNVVHAAESNII